MKSFFWRGTALALGLVCMVSSATAQEGSPSLLPIPVMYSTPYYAGTQAQETPMVDPGSAPQTQQHSTDAYRQAMVQSWSGCDSCGGGCDAGCGATMCDGGCSSCGRQGGGPLGLGLAERVGQMDGMVNWNCGNNCHCWFGGVQGLWMTRDDNNPYAFSYDTAWEPRQLVNSRDANMNWAGGVDIQFGRYFNCGQNALQVVYWGLFPGTSNYDLRGNQVDGALNGILNYADLNYNGATADNFVDNAQLHHIQRNFEFQNVEVNLLGFSSQPCSRVSFNWVAGIRYFKFNEDLKFCTDTTDGIINADANELAYFIETTNNMIGFQIGGDARYCVNRRWNLTAGTKLGLYGNHIEHNSIIGGAAGVATINNGANINRPFFVDTEKNDVAFLGQLQVGAEYKINSCWTATLGYRALAVTGVALTTNQIYHDLRGLQDVERIDSNGSLILHGGYAGLQFNY